MSKRSKHGSRSKLELVDVAAELNSLYKDFDFCKLLKILKI